MHTSGLQTGSTSARISIQWIVSAQSGIAAQTSGYRRSCWSGDILRFRMIPLDDSGLQFPAVCIVYFPLGALWSLIRFSKDNPPIEKHPQPCPHRMRAGFHYDKFSFGDRFQFVRCHKRTQDASAPQVKARRPGPERSRA